MEGNCHLHKEEFNFYCLICKKALCTSCYLENNVCQNQNHKKSIIDYEMFLYGCCEIHYKKFIAGCTKCNRAWCIACMEEKSDCYQTKHRSFISNYLEYKKLVDQSFEKYYLIQEKPIQFHLNNIQEIMKKIKEDSIDKNINKYNLEMKFKNEAKQIYRELKQNSFNYKQSFSLILKKIFNSSLILRTSQRIIRNAQIKAKIFNIEQDKIHERLNKCVKELQGIHNILNNELKFQMLPDEMKNAQEKNKNQDVYTKSRKIIKKENSSYLFDILDAYNELLSKFKKGQSSGFVKDHPLLNFISIIRQLASLYPFSYKTINLVSNQSDLKSITNLPNAISNVDNPPEIKEETQYQWSPFLFYSDGSKFSSKLHLQNLSNLAKFDINFYENADFGNIEQHKNYLFITFCARPPRDYNGNICKSLEMEELQKTCRKIYLKAHPNFGVSSSSFNEGKWDGTLISTDFYLLYLGGQNINGILKTCEIYNEKEDNWKCFSPLNYSNIKICATSMAPSMIFTFGGQSNYNFEKCMLNFDETSSPRWIMLYVRNKENTSFQNAFPLNQNEILIFNSSGGSFSFRSHTYRNGKTNSLQDIFQIFNNNVNPIKYFIFNIKEQMIYKKDMTFGATLNSLSKPRRINDGIHFIARMDSYYYFIQEFEKANLFRLISDKNDSDLLSDINETFNEMYSKNYKDYNINGTDFDMIEKERKELSKEIKKFPNRIFQDFDKTFQMKIYIFLLRLQQYSNVEYEKNKQERKCKLNVKTMTWEENELDF